jgi:hypothetical protein
MRDRRRNLRYIPEGVQANRLVPAEARRTEPILHQQKGELLRIPLPRTSVNKPLALWKTPKFLSWHHVGRCALGSPPEDLGRKERPRVGREYSTEDGSVVADGQAAAEFDFVGKHIGEFAGIERLPEQR